MPSRAVWGRRIIWGAWAYAALILVAGPVALLTFPEETPRAQILFTWGALLITALVGIAGAHLRVNGIKDEDSKGDEKST